MDNQTSLIEQVQRASRSLESPKEVLELAGFLREVCSSENNTEQRKLKHAASFDLMINLAYAQNITQGNWIYCSKSEEYKDYASDYQLYFPFVNACPRCSQHNKFYFAEAKKAKSGSIGKMTSELITFFYENLIPEKKRKDIEVCLLGGTEEADVAFIDHAKKIILLCEIKSSPLVSFPLSVESEELHESEEELIPDHSNADVSTLNKTNIFLYLPPTDTYLPLGKKSGKGYPYKAFLNLAKNSEGFDKYFESWKTVFDAYSNSTKTDSYWLANGCGGPTPRPASWRSRRNGSGFESISDGKSSVGMDRTDDIKKGVYQVLKLGTHYKEFQKDSSGYTVLTALLSNIHAIRHHEAYLLETEDLIWAVDNSKRLGFKIETKNGNVIIPEEHVHNLYDGLLSFTHIKARSDWIKSTFAKIA